MKTLPKKYKTLSAIIVIFMIAFGTYILSQKDFDWDGDGFNKSKHDCDIWDGTEFPGQLWYADCDGDNFARPNVVTACDLANANIQSPCADFSAPDGGWTHKSPGALADCDDTDPNKNPDKKEIPNDGIDNNCNGQVDEQT